jgi:hypothetical protein
VCQPVRRNDCIQAACRRIKEIGGILYFTAQNFKDFKKFKIKVKKLKIYSGLCPFLGQTVLLNVTKNFNFLISTVTVLSPD